LLVEVRPEAPLLEDWRVEEKALELEPWRAVQAAWFTTA
jgi:hypothetical protein